MAIIVSEDDDVIHAATHGMMDREDLRYLRERMDGAVRSAGQYASKYLLAARDTLDRFDFGKLKDRVESLRDRFGKRWDHDRIMELRTISDFQTAKPTMRNYIMANYRLRKLYFQGRIDGYGDLYVNIDGSALGRDHDTWREVMNGSYIDTVEDEDCFVTYMGVLDEYGESKLTHMERDAIRTTWKELEARLDEGKQDPTSPLGKTL